MAYLTFCCFRDMIDNEAGIRRDQLSVSSPAVGGVDHGAHPPFNLAVSHGPDEYIPIKNIAESALIYAMIAVQLLGEG